MSTLHDQLIDAFKSLDHSWLKKIVQKSDLRQTIKICIEDADFSNQNALPLLETLFAHNTADKNFQSELFSSVIMKHYDLARLILKFSPATVLRASALQNVPHDDIYRECGVRAVRACSLDELWVIPEILSRATTSDTMVAILQEIPQSYEVDKYFMDAVMYREYPRAIEFAVERLIGANPDLATNVVTFILSGEVEHLDDLIVPMLNTYPPNEQQKKWISSSINPRWCPIPILDELLNHYVVEDNARLLLEASASQNPIAFSKVVGLFTEEQARNLLEGNKAIKLFSPKTFDADRELLRQHIEHLDNLKQQRVLNNSISGPENKHSARKM